MGRPLTSEGRDIRRLSKGARSQLLGLRRYVPVMAPGSWGFLGLLWVVFLVLELLNDKRRRIQIFKSLFL